MWSLTGAYERSLEYSSFFPDNSLVVWNEMLYWTMVVTLAAWIHDEACSSLS